MISSFYCRQNIGNFRQSSNSLISTCEVAGGGLDEMAAVFLELLDVALGGGVEPHFSVHGWGDEDGGFAWECEVDGCQGIGCVAVGEEGEGVGGGRGDEEKIRAIGEFDVAGFPGLLFIFQGNQHRIAGEGLEGEWGDELASGLGHDRVHIMPGFDKLRCKIGSFVSSDGAGDAEDDFHVSFGSWVSTQRRKERKGSQSSG